MWRESESEMFKWAKIVNKKDLSDVEGFLHYVAFTFRLFRYGQMFKRAVKGHEDEVSLPRHTTPHHKLCFFFLPLGAETSNWAQPTERVVRG
jgi:hypothetical protein